MPELKSPQQQSSTAMTLFEQERESLLPLIKGIDAKRWETFALTALKNPAVLRCTPRSIVAALHTNARLALPLDGVHAALVPYGTECTHVTGYPGYTTLYVRHAGATHADAEVVFEGEEFQVTKGTNPQIVHVAAPGVDRTQPSKVVCTYAVVHLKGGAKKFWVTWRDELDAIRDGAIERSKGRKSPYDGGLTLIEMWRKAPLIRIRKGLNLTENVQKLLADAEREEMGVVVDVHGEQTVSSIDELLAAKKKDDQADTSGLASIEPEVTNGEVVREAMGIPIDINETWAQIADVPIGGQDLILGPLTPNQIVKALREKDPSICARVKDKLDKAHEIYGNGKVPQRGFQVLALAAEQAKSASGDEF